MPKLSKPFRFNHTFTKQVFRAGRMTSDKLTVQVEAMGYRKPNPVEHNDFIHSVDIVTATWLGHDITGMLCFFDLIGEVEEAALKQVPELFENMSAEQAELQKKLDYIREVVKTVKPDGRYLTLHEPIMVRTSPFDLYEVHGLFISPKGQVFAQDEKGMPEEISVQDDNAEVFITAIYNRMVDVFKNLIMVEGVI